MSIWLLIFPLLMTFLVTPLLAQEYRKVSDNTVELSVPAVQVIDTKERDQKISRLEKAKANAEQSAQGYQAEIDALNNPPKAEAIDWSAIKTISYGGINWVDATTVEAEVEKVSKTLVVELPVAKAALNWSDLSDLK